MIVILFVFTRDCFSLAGYFYTVDFVELQSQNTRRNTVGGGGGIIRMCAAQKKKKKNYYLHTHTSIDMTGPATATLSPLSRPDGSASYTCPSTGYNILSSVNAPVELPGRREALRPEDATLEVFVKPGTAPSAVGERYVEGTVRELLGRVILGREKGFPRRGIVLTLAVVGGGDGGYVGRGDSVGTFNSIPFLFFSQKKKKKKY